MSRLASLRKAGIARSVWNISDQVLSSVNNFVVQIAVAQWASSDGFGSFAIVFAVFSVATGFFRSLATSPVGMRFADADDEEFHRAAGAATGLALVGSAVLGVVLVGLGLLAQFPAVVAHSLIGLGLVIPGLIMQDSWRQVLFARLRPAAACLLDGAWGVLQLLAVAVLFAVHQHAVVAYVLAWGGAAVLASVLGGVLAGVRPRVTRARGWLREQASLTRYLVPEYVLLQSGAQLAVIIVAAVATTAAAGSLRGANMLTVPATIVSTGLMSFAVPELARRRTAMSPRRWTAAASAISGFVAVVGILWGSLFLVLPDTVGEALLRDSWAGTQAVLVPIIAGQAGAALAVGPAAVLYATEGASVTIRLHTVYAVALIGFSTVGAVLAGAVGTAWGSAAAFWLVVPWWYLSLRRHVRAVPVSSVPPSPAPVG